MTIPAERVLFLHAHPDDETISTGAAIATIVADGGAATVVTCTRGERGESRPVARAEVDAIGIAAVRRAELQRALEALGATGILLTHEDSGMVWGSDGRATAAPGRSERALTASSVESLADELSAIVEEVDPTAIVSYASDGGYGHPDHVHVAAAAAQVAARYALPLYVRQEAPADAAFALGPVERQVREALGAHRSQLAVDGDEIVHVGGQREPIARIEHYRHVTAAPSGRVRWFLLATTFLAGLVVGVVGTFSHQAIPPWGLVLSLAAAVGLIAGVRLSTGSRAATAAAVIGVIGTIAIVAIDPLGRGAWGSERAIIPADLEGWLWTLVPAAAAFVALAWPSGEALRRFRMASREGAPR